MVVVQENGTGVSELCNSSGQLALRAVSGLVGLEGGEVLCKSTTTLLLTTDLRDNVTVKLISSRVLSVALSEIPTLSYLCKTPTEATNSLCKTDIQLSQDKSRYYSVVIITIIRCTIIIMTIE